MNRKYELGKIVEYLSRFSAEVEIHNSGNEYDVNIFSEDVVIPLLNEIFDLKLINANKIRKNFPAVDLIDTENKVAFQVSSTYDNTKINSTITKFINNNLHKQFDILYIYIIKSETKQLKKDNYETIIGDKFDFNKENNIFTNATIYKRIKYLSLQKISTIKKILEEEFSDKKIEIRKYNNAKTIEVKSELLYPNLLKINFPRKLFIADIIFDKKAVIKKLYKRKRRVSDRGAVKEALNNISMDSYCEDWIIRENKIITFRNLLSENDILTPIIDKGTVVPLTVEEYIDNENYLRNFKSLLNFSLREKLKEIDLEWVNKEKIVRFKAGKIPRKKSISWKLTNKQSSRDVIHEIWNKNEEWIVCFRHLAFSFSFHSFDNEWYISILPTYSFTSINGYSKSRFSAFYQSGIKKLEDNRAVYLHFRFLVDYLQNINPKKGVMFNEEKNYVIELSQPIGIEFSPAIEDKKWNPPLTKKGNKNINENQMKMF